VKNQEEFGLKIHFLLIFIKNKGYINCPTTQNIKKITQKIKINRIKKNQNQA
jgi:hypothetical protein